MSESVYSIIVGTGSYIPTKTVHNRSFLRNEFYDVDGNGFDKINGEIIEDFENITGISERRYVTDDLVASDIAYFAARDALESSGIDGEELDYIILAQDFGDVMAENRRSDFTPSLSSRVKQKLGIENPNTVAYDIVFGCPGWVQGMIQANYYLKSGDAKRVLVIGTETLSRVSDPHDRDSMIYSDGAGATVVETITSSEPVGIISHATRTDTVEQAYLLWMGKSNFHDYKGSEIFLKMDGRAVYEYALTTVPKVIKESIDKAGLAISDMKKFLIHQANTKMVEAILNRLIRLYGVKVKDVLPFILPMTISWLGNSSVATLPTMLDLMYKGNLENHELKKGDFHVFASVGAGMNANSMVYRIP